MSHELPAPLYDAPAIAAYEHMVSLGNADLLLESRLTHNQMLTVRQTFWIRATFQGIHVNRSYNPYSLWVSIVSRVALHVIGFR